MGDHGRVYFPRGTYLIDDDAVFNNAADFQRGFIIEGDGLASSVLLLKTAGAERWFYDNAAGRRSNTFSSPCAICNSRATIPAAAAGFVSSRIRAGVSFAAGC